MARLKADHETMPTIFAHVSILFVDAYYQPEFGALRTLHQPLSQHLPPIFSHAFFSLTCR